MVTQNEIMNLKLSVEYLQVVLMPLLSVFGQMRPDFILLLVVLNVFLYIYIHTRGSKEAVFCSAPNKNVHGVGTPLLPLSFVLISTGSFLVKFDSVFHLYMQEKQAEPQGAQPGHLKIDPYTI